MTIENLTLTLFREETYPLYKKKGVIPPILHSKQEMKLYSQWVKGKKLIKELQHDTD